MPRTEVYRNEKFKHHDDKIRNRDEEAPKPKLFSRKTRNFGRVMYLVTYYDQPKIKPNGDVIYCEARPFTYLGKIQGRHLLAYTTGSGKHVHGEDEWFIVKLSENSADPYFPTKDSVINLQRVLLLNDEKFDAIVDASDNFGGVRQPIRSNSRFFDGKLKHHNFISPGKKIELERKLNAIDHTDWLRDNKLVVSPKSFYGRYMNTLMHKDHAAHFRQMYEERDYYKTNEYERISKQKDDNTIFAKILQKNVLYAVIKRLKHNPENIFNRALGVELHETPCALINDQMQLHIVKNETATMKGFRPFISSEEFAAMLSVSITKEGSLNIGEITDNMILLLRRRVTEIE